MDPGAAIADVVEPEGGRPGPSARTRLRNYFLTGLVVAGPVAVTLYITWWFVTLIDGWVKPFVPAAYLPDRYLPFPIPGFGLVIAFLVLTLIGFLTASLVGRSVLDFGEVVLDRMPLVRGLYKGVKQVFETLFSAEGTSFRTVGLVEFPVKGTWSIVFLSNPAGPEVQGRLEERGGGAEAGDYVGVFLPCSPNPTTGFFFYLPRAEVIEVAMSVDDAAKLVMSAGVIQPETIPPLAAAAGLRAAQVGPIVVPPATPRPPVAAATQPAPSSLTAASLSNR